MCVLGRRHSRAFATLVTWCRRGARVVHAVRGGLHDDALLPAARARVARQEALPGAARVVAGRAQVSRSALSLVAERARGKGLRDSCKRLYPPLASKGPCLKPRDSELLSGWSFRELNELPHVFEARLAKSPFPNPRRTTREAPRVARGSFCDVRAILRAKCRVARTSVGPTRGTPHARAQSVDSSGT